MKKTLACLLTFIFVFACVPAIQAATPAANSIDILNSAPLAPQKTGDPAIDAKVEALLTEFRKSTTDTYGLVKACYDYLINNVSYSTRGHSVPNLQTNGSIPRNVLVDAHQTLFDHVGSCNDYAAAFIVMTRAIGLESYDFSGQTRAAKGGFIGHVWAEIRINGVFYIFDAQVEDNVAKGGEIRYMYFCKTESEMRDRYRWNTSRNARVMATYQNAVPVAQVPTPQIPLRVMYNGIEIELEQPPLVVNERALVPMNAIFTALGAEISWDGTTKTVSSEYGDTHIQLQVNSTSAVIDSEIVPLDIAPQVVDSRTFVPARFVAEALDKDVAWDAHTKTILITDKVVIVKAVD